MEPPFEVMDELQLQSFSLAQKSALANRLYAVIEGASPPEGYQSTGALIYTLENTPSAHPLFFEDDLINVSPWLVEVDPVSPLFDWLIANASDYPFVLFWSEHTIEQIKPFMVNLLKSKSPKGDSLFFRYYDPAVFNIFIEYSHDDVMKERLGGASAIAAYSSFESSPHRFHWRVREFKQVEVNIRSTSSVKPSYITFNQQEWQALCDYKRKTSLKQMGTYLKQNYPNHLKNIDSRKLQQFVSLCIKQGEGLGFSTRNELEQWLDLSMFFGECFVDNHHYSWAQEIVSNTELSTTSKLQQLNQHLDFYQARSAI